MRPRAARNFCAITPVIASVSMWFAGCTSAPAPGVSSTPASALATQRLSQGVALTGRPAAFSPDRAWQHLTALTKLGSRAVGTEGHTQARAYITKEIESLQLTVEPEDADLFRVDLPPEANIGEDGEPIEIPGLPSFIVHNLRTKIAGQRPDADGSILLMAPYDTQAFEDFEFLGANSGGSGAAVLLELARVIAAEPLPYRTDIVFLDAQAPFVAPGTEDERLQAGSYVVGADKDAASGVHLAVYLDRVGDAELRIVRDLLSHRIYREQFWKVAGRMGYRDAFPPAADFESSGLIHRSLARAGLRRIVALVDTNYGGGDPPGLYSGTAEDNLDHCSAKSLGTVGSVTLGGLELISDWLVRIDHFASSGEAASADPTPDAESGSESVTGAATADPTE